MQKQTFLGRIHWHRWWFSSIKYDYILIYSDTALNAVRKLDKYVDTTFIKSNPGIKIDATEIIETLI